jgi:small conductance mechanosensitive channel
VSWDTFLATYVSLADAWLFRATVAIISAVVWWWAATRIRASFDRAVGRTRADVNARLLAGRLVYGGVLAVGGVWVLGIAGVGLAAILATFGVAGLALSLAIQDILKSFFAGLYLLFERPFLIGDEIQVKEHVGRVEHIGFRATSIRTHDHVLVVVPNALFFVEPVQNRTARTLAKGGATQQEPPSA